MIDAPETGETVQVQPVPCQPLAIRRLNVTVTGVTDRDNATTTVAGAPDDVQMGEISVPGQYAGLVDAGVLQERDACLPARRDPLTTSRAFSQLSSPRPGRRDRPVHAGHRGRKWGQTRFDPSSAIPAPPNLLAQFHTAFAPGATPLPPMRLAAGPVEEAGGVLRTARPPPMSRRPWQKPEWHRDHDQGRHSRRPHCVAPPPRLQARDRKAMRTTTRAKATVHPVSHWFSKRRFA